MHYFQGKLSRGFVAIYSGRMILFVSGGLLGLFMPIFLYKFFNFNLFYVVLWYGIGNLLYAILVAFGAQYLNKIGLRKSLRISLLFGVLYYIIFFVLNSLNISSWSFGFDRVLFLLILLIIIMTLNRIFYWVPLHTDIAKFTSKQDRGKEISLINMTIMIMGAVMPLVAGFILNNYDYSVLFIIAIIIYFLALIPWTMLPKTEEKFSWGYWQTWQKFFSKKRRKTILAFITTGAEEVVGVIIWPIFIWNVLNGDYFQVGVLSSIIVVITVILQLLAGQFIDNSSKRKMIKYGSFFYATGWIAKMFITTAFHIFVISAYHNLTRIFSRTSFDTLTYERAADQGHYVDEYTVLHEMAINVGKTLMFILIMFLLFFADIQWTFALAAIFSLGINFLSIDYSYPRPQK